MKSKYTYEKPDRHCWELKGEEGALRFHVSVLGDEPMVWLEIDKSTCHRRGWLTEKLWPMVELYLKTGQHDMIFKLLEEEGRAFGLGRKN